MGVVGRGGRGIVEYRLFREGGGGVSLSGERRGLGRTLLAEGGCLARGLGIFGLEIWTGGTVVIGTAGGGMWWRCERMGVRRESEVVDLPEDDDME